MKLFAIFVLVVFPLTAFCDSPSSKNIETFELTSKIFGNTRTIRVLLPPEYHELKNLDRQYPVFYFNDGLMVFDSAGPGLRIEQLVFDLYKKGSLPQMIIVGIDNGACTDKTTNEIVDRANEFLPYPDAGFLPDHSYKPEPPDPQGKKYPDFLINEVIPRLKQNYRIKSGQQNSGIGGFSYGGVSALYTVIAKPGYFGKLMLESTPLWIGQKYELLQDAKNSQQWPALIYVGVGTKETDERAFNDEGKKNQELLISFIKKQSPDTKLKLVREEGAEHGPDAWRGRLHAALRFLFSK
jgi:predicted alpha/beta superfamily hydrolase